MIKAESREHPEEAVAVSRLSLEPKSMSRELLRVSG